MRTPLLLTLTALSAILPTSQANAACTFGPDTGDNNYTCDSGSAASLTDLTGNNTLTLPAGGSGNITGAVNLGIGNDRIEMHSGTIGGAVVMGDGIDTFIMTGGQIQSLDQGEGLDVFEMSGGRIIGGFDSGDIARMSGGRIGRVDMKLDDNLFDMSGGAIDGNLVTGFGRDTIILGNGTIGGNISVSGGDDSVTISGGDVGGNVLLSSGNDRLVWRDGGLVHGSLQMGVGDDSALLSNLTDTQLSVFTQLNGDLGNDVLTLDNSKATLDPRYFLWETIQLRNGSQGILNSTLSLGDAVSKVGTLAIDASSSLVSSSGIVGTFSAGQNATVDNAGLIDLSSGGDGAGRLTINGNYIGNNGRLKLNSVLGGDGAASDRLVVNQGSISGTTTLLVNNLGGAGALTSANGIQVVEAASGVTSTASAFQLGQRLSVGAYEYYLFKGGVTADSTQSWYLRSSVVAAPAAVVVPEPTPENPTPEPIPPVPAPVAAVGTPPLPEPVAGESIPLYRQEVPVYAVANRAAALVGRSTLGTFHERQGEQGLLSEKGAVPAGWARMYGDHLRQQWSGDVAPSLDGNLRGFQVGHDLYGSDDDSGYGQRVGLYVAHTRLTGDIRGFALGFEDSAAGDMKLDGDSVGAYWTLIGPQQWYVDVVAQYTHLDGRARSDRGLQIDLKGHSTALSVETGFPIGLGNDWVLEPQAQLVGQKVSLDRQNDGISEIRQDSDTNWTGRLGARLKGRYETGGVPLEPYVRANVLHSFSGEDRLTFDDVDTIKTDQQATWMDVGAGVSARLSPAVSVYTGVSYAANLDGRQREDIAGNLGLRISW